MFLTAYKYMWYGSCSFAKYRLTGRPRRVGEEWGTGLGTLVESM